VGSNYSYVVAGTHQEWNCHLWDSCLKSTTDLVGQEVGKLVEVMILNVDQGKELVFDFADMAKFDNYLCSDLLSFYPADGHASVHVDQMNDVWSFAMTVPMSVPGLSETKVKTVLERLWDQLQPLQPKFAAGGEELCLSDDDIRAVLKGKHPLELPLCHISITLSKVRSSINMLGTETIAGGLFERAFVLFADTSND